MICSLNHNDMQSGHDSTYMMECDLLLLDIYVCCASYVNLKLSCCAMLLSFLHVIKNLD